MSLSSTSKPLPNCNSPLSTTILTFDVKVSSSDQIANLLAEPLPSIVPDGVSHATPLPVDVNTWPSLPCAPLI